MGNKSAQSTKEDLSGKPRGGPDRGDEGRNTQASPRPQTSKEKATAMDGNV